MGRLAVLCGNSSRQCVRHFRGIQVQNRRLSNACGIEMAARTYFDKTADTLEEAASRQTRQP